MVDEILSEYVTFVSIKDAKSEYDKDIVLTQYCDTAEVSAHV